MGKKGVVLGLLIVGLGVAWLLNTLHVINGVDWIWTMCLGVTGVITFACMKLDKFSFIVGSFLLIGSIFSLIRQMGRISVDLEVPTLVIIFGVLFLIAQLPVIPMPKVMEEMREEAKKRKSTESL